MALRQAVARYHTSFHRLSMEIVDLWSHLKPEGLCSVAYPRDVEDKHHVFVRFDH
jgi:hypothetical protein